MTVSPAGNRYEVLRAGTGNPPKSGDFVYFHATMQTEGDSVLVNTREVGGDLPVMKVAPDSLVDNEQIGPVEDVIRFLRVGDSAVVRVNLAQFPSKPPGMENDSVLLYYIMPQEIVSEEEFTERQNKLQAEMEAKRAAVTAREPEMLEFAESVHRDYKAGKLADVQTTESGLKYVIHEEGSGPRAEVGRGVVVQYIGKLVENGNVFDQSFQRGQGIPFPLGQGRVIPGWDEGIALLKEGARASLFIPAELGYGAQGAGGDIPPNSELMFYVELEEVQ